MNIADAIDLLDIEVSNPTDGLPDEIFHYISGVTPLVNVDLLIKDENKRTLLAWRNDPVAGTGWHIPGGIIRFKETFKQRIQKVTQLEVGVDDIKYDPTPLALNQIILKDCKIRGHFISILYGCFLSREFIPENKGLCDTDSGYLKWHDSCPDKLLKTQEIYRKYI